MKKITYIVATLTLVFCVLIIYLYLSISTYGKTTKPVRSDVIIVLGAAVWGDRPSPVLRERCDWALKVYHDGYADQFILSGGYGNDDISEAQAMKEYLMEKGVPEESLIVEDQSRSTIENMNNSIGIMNERGFDSAIIVTNRFHLKRANYFAKQFSDYQFSGYGEKTTYLYEPYFTLREVGGFLNDFSKKLTGIYIK